MDGREAAMNCLVLCEHPLVGQALGGLLSEQFGLGLIGTVPSRSLTEAADAIASLQPDLVILAEPDSKPICMGFILALQQISPETRLLLLSTALERPTPPPAAMATVLGVIDGSGSWDQLVTLVSAWQGNRTKAGQPSPAGSLAVVHQLSPRERRVLEAMGKGLSNKQISKELSLSTTTVQTYRKGIAAKCELRGPELMRAAALLRCTTAPATKAPEPPGPIQKSDP